MKKTIAILAAFLAFAACTKEKQEPQDVQVPDGTVENYEIKLNITVNREDGFAETKASIKEDWYIGDKIYLIIKDLPMTTPARYLEMERTGTGWKGTGIQLDPESIPASGTLTAVFLPYGSSAAISALRSGDDVTGYAFSVGNQPYSGYFLRAENVPFTYDQTNGLTSTLTLNYPDFGDGAILVHYDVSSIDSQNEYYLYQEFLKPIKFRSVMADGTVSMDIGSAGQPIPGYKDYGWLSFSGVSAKISSPATFQFAISDETACILYNRAIENKTVTTNKCIGLGSLTTNGSKWQAHAFVDFYMQDEQGNRLLWATRNLGATSDTDPGYYYLWGHTEPLQYANYAAYMDACWEKYDNGSHHYTYYDGPYYKYRNPHGPNEIDHSFQLFNDTPSIKLTKYITNADAAAQGASVDNKQVLDPEDDAATATWGFPWRIPTKEDWGKLLNECTWTNNRKGPDEYSNPSGQKIREYYTGNETITYANKTMVLPVNDLFDDLDRGDDLTENAPFIGAYWSSSLFMPSDVPNVASPAEQAFFNSYSSVFGASLVFDGNLEDDITDPDHIIHIYEGSLTNTNPHCRLYGLGVRPVFSLPVPEN